MHFVDLVSWKRVSLLNTIRYSVASFFAIMENFPVEISFKKVPIVFITLSLQLNIHTYVHMCVRIYVRTYIHTYIHINTHINKHTYIYRCPRRNVPDFERVFLMLKYTDITQNTNVQSWTVTEKMAREKCGLLTGPRTVPVSWQSYPFRTLSLVSHFGNSADASHWTQFKCIAHAVQVKAALWMVGRLVVRCC